MVGQGGADQVVSSQYTRGRHQAHTLHHHKPGESGAQWLQYVITTLWDHEHCEGSVTGLGGSLWLNQIQWFSLFSDFGENYQVVLKKGEQVGKHVRVKADTDKNVEESVFAKFTSVWKSRSETNSWYFNVFVSTISQPLYLNSLPLRWILNLHKISAGNLLNEVLFARQSLTSSNVEELLFQTKILIALACLIRTKRIQVGISRDSRQRLRSSLVSLGVALPATGLVSVVFVRKVLPCNLKIRIIPRVKD